MVLLRLLLIRARAQDAVEGFLKGMVNCLLIKTGFG